MQLPTRLFIAPIPRYSHITQFLTVQASLSYYTPADGWTMSEIVAHGHWAHTVSTVAGQNNFEQLIEQVWKWNVRARVQINIGAVITSQETRTEGTPRTPCRRSMQST